VLLYETLTWTAAAFLAFWVRWTFSDLSFGDLWKPSFAASAPALWLVPGGLLLAAPAPLPEVCGAALMVTICGVLLSRIAQAWSTGGNWVRARRPLPVFSYVASPRPFFTRQRMAVIAGSLAVQFSVCAFALGQSRIAALLAGIGVAHWMAVWLAGRDRRQPIAKHGWRLLVSIPIAVLLAVALMAATAAGDEDEGSLAMLRSFLKPPAKTAAPALRATRLARTQRSAAIDPEVKDLIEGVRLTPEKKNLQPAWIATPHGRWNGLISRPLTIPFTGEYLLFPASSPDTLIRWVLQPGTPLDTLYQTLHGGALKTEAFQPLDPPVDFTRCGAIRLVLTSGDPAPVAVWLSLLANRDMQEFGPEVFGFDRGGKETLEFTVPRRRGGGNVNGIRVRFEGVTAPATRSIRIAVEQFTLIPAAD
jgi:hypothetical protein